MPRVETITRTLYKFAELPEDIKSKAIDKLSDINIHYEWWEYIYEDAERSGLKITSFDLDRNKHAEGNLTESPLTVITRILVDHGKECATAKTALKWQSVFAALDETSDNFEEGYEEALSGFTLELLADYADMLQKECDYKQSEEAIIETIEANYYEFDEHGNLA